MPLLWNEVDSSLDPRSFTIRNAMERMDRLGEDPVSPVLESKPDLVEVLEHLAGILAS